MKRLAFIAALFISSAAFAGEDSTHRAYGYGPAWYGSNCGLRQFNWDARTKREAEQCIKATAE
jgi:hypothetical protein